ncbi:major capsid hexamer protein [Microbacterium phage Namago]|nr:major capsid hexamer protein [Microbacterium phage Namago]QWY80109.1 major capsid hexamer protein [Microbacterium phage StrawberryJamm]UVG34283.1 major capsid hexamer protein [Microbacterium phage Grassboy]
MFTMPETLDGLSLPEITELRAAAVAAANELNALADDVITAEQTTELIALIDNVGTLSDRVTELEGSEATAAQLAAARAKLADLGKDDAGTEGADADADAADADAEGADADADAEGADAEKRELIVASAAGGAAPAGRTFTQRVADKNVVSGRNEIERDVNRILEQSKGKELAITAAANIGGFSSGETLNFTQLAEAYAKRGKTFASRIENGQRRMSGRKMLSRQARTRSGLSDAAERYSVARLAKPDNAFQITQGMSSQGAWDVIMKAAAEGRLKGNSLTAAGGWCAPSEIIFGFLELETAEGIMSMPEIGAPRGGIQFTKGPQLGDLLIDTDLGWVMTEAQAEAGGFTKPVFDIECPDWDEVRMDAVGWALRAGLLTNTTYPELLRRYLALALIVHARRMNKLTIDRTRALITQTMTLASVGAVPSATADFLDAIELGAMRIREQFSMGLNATVEGKFPLWARMVVRSDLSRRTGVDMLSVSNRQIDGWFSERQISPEFVRDYQPINGGATTVEGGTGNWTTMPTKIEFMLYPAGSYVRIAEDVMDLDTVYDQDNLTKNQFLAAFFEEGFNIVNTGANGVKVTVALPNRFGVTGAAIIGDLANDALVTP